MAVFKKALPESKREVAKCFSQMLEMTNDALRCEGKGVGVRNQVRGRERLWDW